MSEDRLALQMRQPYHRRRTSLESPMKPSSFHVIFWIAIISVTLSFSSAMFGQDTTGMLSKALDLVHQAEKPRNPPTDAQRIDLLTQAIKAAQEAPNHRLRGHRVQAIQFIRAAVTEILKNDPDHKAADYLRDADSELSAAVSLAGSAAAPQVAAPSSSTPSPATASVVADKDPTAPPPGVTLEMEQAFLAKYKAALAKQDPDAFFSLVAIPPDMDPKAKEALKGDVEMAFVLDLSNLNRTYSFVPLPSGKEDRPTELAGKMYGDYIPAVIALKITFGKQTNPAPLTPVGDTILPLGVKDHQLMLVGMKEIPGAVPPPAVGKSANFGIEPNLRKVSNKTEWENGNAFTSLNEFLSCLKQPSVEILASGEGKFEYYAICRIAPNLCVYAGGDKVGEANYSFYIKAADSNKQELKGSQKWIRLVDVPTDNGHAPNVQGTVFFVPDHYAGPITIDAQYLDDAGKKASSFSQTIDWK